MHLEGDWRGESQSHLVYRRVGGDGRLPTKVHADDRVDAERIAAEVRSKDPVEVWQQLH